MFSVACHFWFHISTRFWHAILDDSLGLFQCIFTLVNVNGLQRKVRVMHTLAACIQYCFLSVTVENFIKVLFLNSVLWESSFLQTKNIELYWGSIKSRANLVCKQEISETIEINGKASLIFAAHLRLRQVSVGDFQRIMTYLLRDVWGEHHLAQRKMKTERLSSTSPEVTYWLTPWILKLQVLIRHHNCYQQKQSQIHGGRYTSFSGSYHNY